jgi:hypothetical protein
LIIDSNSLNDAMLRSLRGRVCKRWSSGGAKLTSCLAPKYHAVTLSSPGKKLFTWPAAERAQQQGTVIFKTILER